MRIRCRVGKSLALGSLHPDHAAVAAELEIDILGQMHKAMIAEVSPYDPENARRRA